MPLDDASRAQIQKFEVKLKPIEEQMAPLLAEARKWRGAINAVYEAADEAAPYKLEDDTPAASLAIKVPIYANNEFYGMPFATAATKLITERGGLTDDQLFDFLHQGGFDFEEPNPERAKTNMKIALGKNMKFKKLPNGVYTLTIGPPVARKRPQMIQDGKTPEGVLPDAAESA